MAFQKSHFARQYAWNEWPDSSTHNAGRDWVPLPSFIPPSAPPLFPPFFLLSAFPAATDFPRETKFCSSLQGHRNGGDSPGTQNRRRQFLHPRGQCYYFRTWPETAIITRSGPKSPAAEIGVGGDFSGYIAYLDPFCFVVRRKRVDKRTFRFSQANFGSLLED